MRNPIALPTVRQVSDQNSDLHCWDFYPGFRSLSFPGLYRIYSSYLFDPVFHIEQPISKLSCRAGFKSPAIVFYLEANKRTCMTDRNKHVITPGVLGDIVKRFFDGQE